MIGEWQSLQVFIGSLLIFHSLVPAKPGNALIYAPGYLDYLIFHSLVATATLALGTLAGTLPWIT